MRPAYWRLHLRGGHSAVVLGRKFCAGCGHWRHVCDFSPMRGQPRGRCHPCQNRYQRAWHAHMTPDQRARRREYDRIYKDAKRRQAGQRALRPRHPPLRAERVFFPPGPLLALLNDAVPSAAIPSWEVLSRLSGLDGHTIRRLRFGESAHVRIDVADRLAAALGLPLALVYPNEYREERRAV